MGRSPRSAWSLLQAGHPSLCSQERFLSPLSTISHHFHRCFPGQQKLFVLPPQASEVFKRDVKPILPALQIISLSVAYFCLLSSKWSFQAGAGKGAGALRKGWCHVQSLHLAPPLPSAWGTFQSCHVDIHTLNSMPWPNTLQFFHFNAAGSSHQGNLSFSCFTFFPNQLELATSSPKLVWYLAILITLPSEPNKEQSFVILYSISWLIHCMHFTKCFIRKQTQAAKSSSPVNSRLCCLYWK